MDAANRVIKNTGFLYAKMAITVFVSLYTTRLLLSSLGAIDFGIFNVVGGIIAMLGFLDAAMAGATQRFMSIAEGEGKPEKKKAIFNISIILHLAIAIVLGLVLLIVGYFFFNGILNIPDDRVYAAKVVYGSMIVSTMLTVMTVPYEAVLNSHENMLYYAIVGVIESFLKLAVAFIVVYALQDKLIVYGVLMAVISLLVMAIMRIYCHRRYEECIIAPRRYWDRSLMRQMTGFAGWNLLNNASRMISQYGLGIVLNNFFGAILNAAQGIANQISGQLMAFSNTMIKAVSPMIAKSEGAGEREKMLNASLLSAKYGYLLFAIFAVPFLLETPYILEIWLEEVPDWAVLFVRLQLILLLVEQLTLMVGRSVEVQGDIKVYFALQSFLNILPIVLTYLFFSFGFPPYYLYIIWILVGGIISGSVCVYFAKLKCGLKFSDFMYKVFYPSVIPTIGMLITGAILVYWLEESFLRLLFVIGITTISFIIIVYTTMAKNEKSMIISLIKLLKKKIFK
ncbi:Na+-driven multidrug efflux pump [Porphyromonadaceae bacterium NLAE-zl-C104]|nr:Na+-driven multidrug efflux pump [Porphyromonadaceae bacterium NLAE-zl-C104]